MVASMGKVRQRSIPAWAGETIRANPAGSATPVDPRVGGGDTSVTSNHVRRLGRSPRGRGRLELATPPHGRSGSIPAWAGETRRSTWTTSGARVDPRVGGGDGNTSRSMAYRYGRSPRGRGRRCGDRASRRRHGSIPAWAGETEGASTGITTAAVDPRVGGGDSMDEYWERTNTGRSPRGRGRRRLAVRRSPTTGSIPAWAGETPVGGPLTRVDEVDPRVGGGDEASRASSSSRRRSIPAWAGETRQGQGRRRQDLVDPRVGGGDRTTSVP